jgi:riboflavin kinase / FMN adenylyltransferase
MKSEDSTLSRRGRFLVVIGNFDGVHRGHQVVLRAACAEATRQGLSVRLLTFDPHPRRVLLGMDAELLTTIDTRIRLIREQFPDVEVWVEPFTRELSLLDPEQFARSILKGKLDAAVVLVGEDFRFGHRRAGDLARLVELGRELNFEARSIPLAADGTGQVYTSSRIRELIKAGDVVRAAALLGRPHSFRGEVVHGDGRGRELGFPTANLAHVPEVLPAFGIYAGLARLPDGSSYRAVVSHGPRPTVERPVATEVHVLEFEGDLYGQWLEVEIWARLREVRRFDSLPELITQIELDIAESGNVTEAPG